MVCLGLEPGAAGWYVQMYPPSYGGTPILSIYYLPCSAFSLQVYFFYSVEVGRRVKVLETDIETVHNLFTHVHVHVNFD